MKIRDPKSIIVIFVYVALNAFIVGSSFFIAIDPNRIDKKKASRAPEYTYIENLDYFHLREGIPQLSLSATNMRSEGEVYAEFENPKGVYNYQKNNETIRYKGDEGVYKKAKEILTLTGHAEIDSSKGEYFADQVKYFLKKDLLLGKGNVRFEGTDPKTRDHVTIKSDSMRANPEKQYSYFQGAVNGQIIRKKEYEGKSTFSSQSMELKGTESLAHLETDVVMKRQNYVITGRAADIYLENFNKSLKYFVVNDDVKLTESMKTPEGVVQRKAFAERLEGFGREQKMVLSGAPRVETGQDVIKGYRITFRENVDLLEVDDAMSDIQTKKKKLKE